MSEKHPEGKIIKDAYGGFTEHFPNGSQFVFRDTKGTTCESSFFPPPSWSDWHNKYIVKSDGKTTYEACHTCGWRHMFQRPGGYAPVDTGWVRDGEWTPNPKMPQSPSGLAKEKDANA